MRFSCKRGCLCRRRPCGLPSTHPITPPPPGRTCLTAPLPNCSPASVSQSMHMDIYVCLYKVYVYVSMYIYMDIYVYIYNIYVSFTN